MSKSERADKQAHRFHNPPHEVLVEDFLDRDQAAVIGELSTLCRLILAGGEDLACGDWVPWPRLRSGASTCTTVLGADHRTGEQGGVLLHALRPAEVLVELLVWKVEEKECVFWVSE